MERITTEYFHTNRFSSIEEIRGLQDCVEYEYTLYLDYSQSHGYMRSDLKDYDIILTEFKEGRLIFKCFIFRGQIVRFVIVERAYMEMRGCSLNRYYPVRLEMEFDLGLIEDIGYQFERYESVHFVVTDNLNEKIILLNRDKRLVDTVDMQNAFDVSSIKYRIAEGAQYINGYGDSTNY